MKPFLPLLGLSLFLAACGSATPPVATASISLSGPTNLKIGEAKALSAAAKDSSGAVLSGRTFTWTSSAPNVVAVDASGNLMVKRLSVTPITLTVKEGDKSGTLSVTTYGLELTVGTYNYGPGTPNAKIGTAALVKFRSPAGKVAGKSSVSIKAPSGAALSGLAPVISPATTSQTSDLKLAIADAPVSGSYTASATIDGVEYTSSASINTASRLGSFQNGKFSFPNSKTFTITGTPASDTALFDSVLYDGGADKGYTCTSRVNKTTYVCTGDAGILPSTYEQYIYSFNTDYADFTVLTPDQFNASFVYLGTTTLTAP